MCSSGFSDIRKASIDHSPYLLQSLEVETAGRVPGVERQLRDVPDRDPDQQGPRLEPAREPQRSPRTKAPRSAIPIDASSRRRSARPSSDRRARSDRNRAHRRGHHSDRASRDHRRERTFACPAAASARTPAGPRPPRPRPPSPGTAGTPRPAVRRRSSFRSPFVFLTVVLRCPAASDWRIRLYIPPITPRRAPISSPQGRCRSTGPTSSRSA